jgi:hypothetical protein
MDNGLCDMKTRPKQDTLQLQQALKLYSSSIFPTIKDIEDIYGKKPLSPSAIDSRLFMKHGDLKLHILLEKYPGIYYFMACRPPCDKSIDITKVQRQTSLDKLPKEKIIIEKQLFIKRYLFGLGYTLIKHKAHFNYLCDIIKEYIEDYGTNSFINEISIQLNQDIIQNDSNIVQYNLDYNKKKIICKLYIKNYKAGQYDLNKKQNKTDRADIIATMKIIIKDIDKLTKQNKIYRKVQECLLYKHPKVIEK